MASHLLLSENQSHLRADDDCEKFSDLTPDSKTQTLQTTVTRVRRSSLIDDRPNGTKHRRVTSRIESH